MEKVMPTCKDCGYHDPEPLILHPLFGLDMYDFICPKCGSNWFDFPEVK